MAAIVVKDIFGNVVPGPTFSFPTTTFGTTQFLRVSFEDVYTDPVETVEIPTSISSGGTKGEIVDSPLTLEFDDETSEQIIIVRGLDESGDFELELGPSDDSGGDPDFDNLDLSLTFTNNAAKDGGSNTAPTEPVLKHPAKDANYNSNTKFEWEHAYDREGDELLYHLCFADNKAMDDQRCVTIRETNIVEESGVAAIGGVSALLICSALLATFFVKSQKNPRLRVFKLWLSFLFVGVLIGACGNMSLLDALKVGPRPIVRLSSLDIAEPLLLPNNNETYFWRVYADDSKGNVTPSSESRRLEFPAP